MNNSNGELRVTDVSISSENTITGVLYMPLEPREDAPCVLLAHGITNSKEPLSGIALELAKHGYIALSIDLVGHGRSTGSLSGNDQSLGVVQSAEYLLEYSNNTHIGLVGHSLGAGAVYYAASHGVTENGIVLIGGGIGSNAYQNSSGGFMPSRPWNPLVIIGRYDVLFTPNEINESLMITFPNSDIELNTLKGDPQGASMRMLLMPYTSHLLEPIDPVVVDATVDWFNTINEVETKHTTSYLHREALILFGLLFFIAALVFALSIGSQTSIVSVFNWRNGAVYGLIGFITFVPAMLVGNFVPFPPQIFGASIAWWLLVWGIVTLVLSVFWKKLALPKVNLNEIGYAVLVFVIAYVLCSGLETFFGFGFRMLVPIMRSLSARRSIAFLSYLPFMLPHFYSEAMWFHEKASNLLGLAVSKLGLFGGLLFVQYGGFFLLDTVFVSGFMGFILEFLMAIVPLLLISVFITWWSVKNGRLGYSIVLNALLLSWIAAGLFPY
ncbi:MAG: alpha/beta hydrolase [Candidatus Bathyarchaeota archaeon]|nr:alpha/beta hydrolase [Candidatus Bathyarchaeota archaeon]